MWGTKLVFPSLGPHPPSSCFERPMAIARSCVQVGSGVMTDSPLLLTFKITCAQLCKALASASPSVCICLEVVLSKCWEKLARSCVEVALLWEICHSSSLHLSSECLCTNLQRSHLWLRAESYVGLTLWSLCAFVRVIPNNKSRNDATSSHSNWEYCGPLLFAWGLPIKGAHNNYELRFIGSLGEVSSSRSNVPWWVARFEVKGRMRP